MTEVFMRIMKVKERRGLSWDELAEKAGIATASWMTGIPTSMPSDDDLRRIAKVLDTTYDFLKNGR